VTVTVSEALEDELLAMPGAVRNSTLAAGARVAASILDGEPGARDAASLLKELRAAMADLRAMADRAPEESDPIDELSRRRHDRVAGSPVPHRAAGGRQ
jgi:hypothetical protein